MERPSWGPRAVSADLVSGPALQDAHELLVVSINATLQEWLREQRAVDGAQINSGAARGGCCSDFAGAVIAKLGGARAADVLGVEVLGIDNFQIAEDLDRDGRPLDRVLLGRHWPKVVPPDALTWDDLDQLAEAAAWGGGTHVWLSLGGLHYDAEASNGVENFFELPFFSRVLSAWLAERGMAPNARR